MLLRKSGIWGTLAVAGLLVSGSASAALSGSVHDLAYPGAELCGSCHTPHNGTTNAPLWNHDISTETFIPYDSPTIQASSGTIGVPTGVSLMCLSCHDGQTAVDAFGGGTPVPTLMTGNAVVGLDLGNDHPIGFTYDAALQTADGGLNDPTTGTIASWLNGDQMECSSCHDVHNGAAAVANGTLLRASMTNSALCTTCHNK